MKFVTILHLVERLDFIATEPDLIVLAVFFSAAGRIRIGILHPGEYPYCIKTVPGSGSWKTWINEPMLVII